MTRLQKELKKVGLIYDSMDDIFNNIHYSPENDENQSLVTVANGYIICIYRSAVLDPELRLYDKNYNFVASQNLYPDTMFFGNSNKWSSII